MADDKASIEARLRAGEWMTIAPVAAVLDVDRSTVARWLTAGKIGYRQTPSGYRRCNPDDVLALLAEYRDEKRGGKAPRAE